MTLYCNECLKPDTGHTCCDGEGWPKKASELKDKIEREICRLEKMLEEAAMGDYDFDDPCPECGTQLKSAIGGGVKCPKPGCDYWFCF